MTYENGDVVKVSNAHDQKSYRYGIVTSLDNGNQTIMWFRNFREKSCTLSNGEPNILSDERRQITKLGSISSMLTQLSIELGEGS